jgi:hypothetical protein
MVLGGGHRRQLRNGAGNGGDMADWERLTDACDQIDTSQLLLAIKDLTEQGCMSPALDNECSDGWHLAASEVCFSAGGADAAGVSECTTTGGNAPEGSSCAFPFVYNDVTYNECTLQDGGGQAWCSLNADYVGGGSQWGVCVCDVTDAHYGTFSLPAASPGLKLVHKSGGVSCNSGRGFLSNWGCDLEEDSLLGTFVTTECSSGCDTSHIVAPAASRAGDGWWYPPYDANWGGSDELIFQEDHDAAHPQGDFPAGNYQVWYGEDLDPTGAKNAFLAPLYIKKE